MHNLLSFPFCRRSVAHFKLKMTLLLTQNQQFNCKHLILQPHKTSHLELHIFVQKITLKSPRRFCDVRGWKTRKRSNSDTRGANLQISSNYRALLFPLRFQQLCVTAFSVEYVYVTMGRSILKINLRHHLHFWHKFSPRWPILCRVGR